MSQIRVDEITDEAGTGSPSFPNGTPGFPLTSSDMPAGSVIQVVQGSSATQTTTTSSSYSDSSLSLSITPLSASSKVLVIVSQQLTVRGANIAFNVGGLQLVRASTTIFTNDFAAVVRANSTSGTAASGGLVPLVYLDSPNTTSSTTYKTQIRSLTGQNVIAQDGSTPSTITLMEIAG